MLLLVLRLLLPIRFIATQPWLQPAEKPALGGHWPACVMPGRPFTISCVGANWRGYTVAETGLTNTDQDAIYHTYFDDEKVIYTKTLFTCKESPFVRYFDAATWIHLVSINCGYRPETGFGYYTPYLQEYVTTIVVQLRGDIYYALSKINEHMCYARIQSKWELILLYNTRRSNLTLCEHPQLFLAMENPNSKTNVRTLYCIVNQTESAYKWNVYWNINGELCETMSTSFGIVNMQDSAILYTDVQYSRFVLEVPTSEQLVYCAIEIMRVLETSQTMKVTAAIPIDSPSLHLLGSLNTQQDEMPITLSAGEAYKFMCSYFVHGVITNLVMRWDISGSVSLYNITDSDDALILITSENVNNGTALIQCFINFTGPLMYMSHELGSRVYVADITEQPLVRLTHLQISYEKTLVRTFYCQLPESFFMNVTRVRWYSNGILAGESAVTLDVIPKLGKVLASKYNFSISNRSMVITCERRVYLPGVPPVMSNAITMKQMPDDDQTNVDVGPTELPVAVLWTLLPIGLSLLGCLLFLVHSKKAQRFEELTQPNAHVQAVTDASNIPVESLSSSTLQSTALPSNHDNSIATKSQNSVAEAKSSCSTVNLGTEQNASSIA